MSIIRKRRKRFYKYQATNSNLFDNLKNKQLYFNDPSEYNDPLDSKVSCYLKATREKWGDYLKKINKIEDTQLIDFFLTNILIQNTLQNKEIKKKKKNIKSEESLARAEYIVQNIPDSSTEYCPLTCCFSEESDNMLMWSHYANGHKGVCLCFKSKYESFTELRLKPEYALTVDFESSPLFPIKYDLERPKPINLVDDFLANTNQLFDCLLFDFLLTKSPCWSYEKEHRMFLTEPDAQNKAYFEEKELEGIIFGLRVNYGDAHTIIKIIEKYYNDIPVKFYKTRISRDKYAFEKVKINYDKIDDYLDDLPL
jgi:hypothetical protein